MLATGVATGEAGAAETADALNLAWPWPAGRIGDGRRGRVACRNRVVGHHGYVPRAGVRRRGRIFVLNRLQHALIVADRVDARQGEHAGRIGRADLGGQGSDERLRETAPIV